LRKRRILFFVISILVGVLAGIGYGWWLRPQFYSQADLSNLRTDYRTDYVLMTAEIFQVERDAAEARQRLANLGPEPPEFYAQEAVLSAGQIGYSQNDLQMLVDLVQVLQPIAATPVDSGGSTP
jgi:hypothetical protein